MSAKTIEREPIGSFPQTCVGSEREGRGGKSFARLFSVLVLFVTLMPICENWRAAPRDDFPLSYYPMFSKPRDRAAKVTYILGMDEQGNEQVIPYRYAGSGGFNQVRKQLRKSVRRGRGDELCHRIAWMVGRHGGAELAGVDTVAIVTGKFDVNAYFDGDQEPESLELEAICKVKRSQP